jgi:hypothetical protein
MKLKLIIGAIIGGLLAFSFCRIRDLKSENIRLNTNQTQLLSQSAQIIEENNNYKVADSLNGLRTNELLLTISEYERYRQKDAALIAQLTSKNSNLEKVISSQTATINELSLKLIDSIVIDTIAHISDTLKCFTYKSQWTDVTGCIDLNKDKVDIQLQNRESIKVIETIKYKRFLNFLWKTNRIESKQIDVISENPNTIIIKSEAISIVG